MRCTLAEPLHVQQPVPPHTTHNDRALHFSCAADLERNMQYQLCSIASSGYAKDFNCNRIWPKPVSEARQKAGAQARRRLDGKPSGSLRNWLVPHPAMNLFALGTIQFLKHRVPKLPDMGHYQTMLFLARPWHLRPRPPTPPLAVPGKPQCPAPWRLQRQRPQRPQRQGPARNPCGERGRPRRPWRTSCKSNG